MRIYDAYVHTGWDDGNWASEYARTIDKASIEGSVVLSPAVKHASRGASPEAQHLSINFAARFASASSDKADPFHTHSSQISDVAEAIRYAKDKGLSDVVLNTNGVLMTRDKAKAVIQAGLDVIYVGIDAATEESYSKIRVGGDYNKAVENVLNYRDLLREYGRDKQELFVQYVVSDINEHEVEDFKDFWKKENVAIKIRPKVSWAGLVEARNLEENEIVGRKPCYWLMRTINICADGRVALCSVDVHCRVECGDISKNTIKEVWAEGLDKYRTMHREGMFGELPDMCRNCQDWQSAYADFVQCE